MPASSSGRRSGQTPPSVSHELEFDALLARVRNAFGQLPTLTLSPDDGRRRWRTDEITCRRAFEALRRLDYLVERPDGRYARRDACLN